MMTEIDPDEPGDQEPWSALVSPGRQAHPRVDFQDIIVTIPRISKRMGLATRVPGPPGVTDNKTINVFMISDPKNHLIPSRSRENLGDGPGDQGSWSSRNFMDTIGKGTS
ncbi:hypothetical protein NQ318_004075 [Aromia moschata]|uniref:Uncharacterized protein n=1 Tax=Aromia moschata TaxID=1265417 RepID=A0AAV8Z808_9CUCU|nr:hypothetical protein NQ318_004075 [Aromia moschata]